MAVRPQLVRQTNMFSFIRVGGLLDGIALREVRFGVPVAELPGEWAPLATAMAEATPIGSPAHRCRQGGRIVQPTSSLSNFIDTHFQARRIDPYKSRQAARV